MVEQEGEERVGLVGCEMRMTKEGLSAKRPRKARASRLVMMHAIQQGTLAVMRWDVLRCAALHRAALLQYPKRRDAGGDARKRRVWEKQPTLTRNFNFFYLRPR